MAKGRSYELARMARAELKKAVPPVYARSIVLAHLRKRCMGLAIFID